MLNVICKINSVDDKNEYLLVHSHKESNSMVRLQFGDGEKLIDTYSWDIENAVENAMSTGNRRRADEAFPIKVDCEVMAPDNEEKLALTISSTDDNYRIVKLAIPKGASIEVCGEDLITAVANCKSCGLRRFKSRTRHLPRRSAYECYSDAFDDEE